MTIYHCVVRGPDGRHSSTTVSGSFTRGACAAHLRRSGFDLISTHADATKAATEASNLNAAASVAAASSAPVTAEGIANDIASGLNASGV